MYDFSLFSERLRKCIDESGMTQVEIANLLGISKFSLTKYLGGRVPEPTILYSIAKFFNKSIEWFLTGEESENRTIVQLQQQKVEAEIDPDLKEMIDLLHELMHSDDADLRGWAKIQFKNAFKDYCPYSEKKQHA